MQSDIFFNIREKRADVVFIRGSDPFYFDVDPDSIMRIEKYKPDSGSDLVFPNILIYCNNFCPLNFFFKCFSPGYKVKILY